MVRRRGSASDQRATTTTRMSAVPSSRSPAPANWSRSITTSRSRASAANARAVTPKTLFARNSSTRAGTGYAGEPDRVGSAPATNPHTKPSRMNATALAPSSALSGLASTSRHAAASASSRATQSAAS
jgi:hypothetical protein